MASSSSGALSAGVIREAMAYRVKYRVSGGKQKLPLRLLGVHQMNRGGVYPMSETVQTLGRNILVSGFSKEEANHHGVVVEEAPAGTFMANPWHPGRQYENLSEYNKRETSAVAGLESCFVAGAHLLYGALSHNHLLLALLSLSNQAAWPITSDLPAAERELAALQDRNGRWDFAAVAARDPALAETIQDGLEVEVLSWKMVQEVPQAASLISQALNKGHQLALQTTEITALAVLSGAISMLESAVADSVAFETAQAKVRSQLDSFVDDPDFVHLFEFVVNMGAHRSPFIPQLLDFAAKYVDPKKRQLRLVAFAEVNKLPLAAPRSKIAVLMRAYRKEPSRGFCPSPESAWARLEAESILRLEQLLHYFHVTLMPILEKMTESARRALLSNVSLVAAEAVIAAKSQESVSGALAQAVANLHAEAEKTAAVAGVDMPQPADAWIKFDAVASGVGNAKPSAGKPSASTRLLPQLIRFDLKSGQPLNQQETVAMESKPDAVVVVAPFPWQE